MSEGGVRSAWLSRVVPGRARGHGLEQRVDRPHVGVHLRVRKRARVLDLQNKKADRAAQGQDGGNHQHELGVQRQARKAHMVPLQVEQHGKPDAPHRDQRADDELHHGVIFIVGKSSHQVESRVAERRNRVEDRVPDAARHAVLRDHARHEQHRADALDGKDQHHDAHGQGDHALQPLLVQAVGDDQALAERDAPAQKDQDQRAQRHEPQAPDLDERDQRHLPKERKVAAGVDDRKARHAHGRGRRKQRVQEGEALARAGQRQVQQQRAEEDERAKAQHQHARGRGDRLFGPSAARGNGGRQWRAARFEFRFFSFLCSAVSFSVFSMAVKGIVPPAAANVNRPAFSQKKFFLFLLMNLSTVNLRLNRGTLPHFPRGFAGFGFPNPLQFEFFCQNAARVCNPAAFVLH